MALGGEVFVLDMGDPIKIYDLALRMVRLSGLSLKSSINPKGDIEIIKVGLRPGEKLYEELLIGDNPRPTQHPRIMQAKENFLPWSALQSELTVLQEKINANEKNLVIKQMQHLVTGYTPDARVSD
jgi:FlaA1/EpsC-like NDP-sugar epimerase